MINVTNTAEEKISERHFHLGIKTDSKQLGLNRTRGATSEPNLSSWKAGEAEEDAESRADWLLQRKKFWNKWHSNTFKKIQYSKTQKRQKITLDNLKIRRLTRNAENPYSITKEAVDAVVT